MRLHDFTVQTWGHALHDLRIDPETLTGSCSIHCTPSPKVGDRIRYVSSYGFTTVEVTASTWVMSVDDMYDLEVRLAHREVTNPAAKGQAPEGEVAWPTSTSTSG